MIIWQMLLRDVGIALDELEDGPTSKNYHPKSTQEQGIDKCLICRNASDDLGNTRAGAHAWRSRRILRQNPPAGHPKWWF